MVVLPEPFGPINPRMVFCWTSSEQLLTAAIPPNLFVTFSTSSKDKAMDSRNAEECRISR
jgi:hypothetical protein